LPAAAELFQYLFVDVTGFGYIFPVDQIERVFESLFLVVETY
jgi:hypothetical protein